jgi:hypothetical protein
LTGTTTNTASFKLIPLSNERVISHPNLKAEIAEFSKDSLKELEHCLKQREPLQGFYELIAKCLRAFDK